MCLLLCLLSRPRNRDTQYQWAHLAPRSSFLTPFSKERSQDSEKEWLKLEGNTWDDDIGTWPLQSSPQTCYSSLTMRKTSDRLQQTDILQNTWPVFLRTVKGIKTRKIQEIVMWLINVMWYPGWDPGTENWGNMNQSLTLLINNTLISAH